MKKILIVDDEIFVRIGIKSIVNWEEYGYSVVGEASNGQEAMEKIEKYTPDIVLADLMMDKMDGFELISECRKKYPKIKFIVLSSFNDFDNVRKAMKLGASDYIFKLTAKPENMLSVLDEVSKTMEDEPKAKKSDSILLENISVIKTKLIKTAIQQSYINESELLEEISLLKLKTDFIKPYVSLYISVDNYKTKQNEKIFPEKQLLKFSMENIINEVISKNHIAETYNYDEGNLIVLIHPNNPENYNELCRELESDVTIIIEYIKRYLGVAVSASLSEIFTGIKNMKTALNQNIQAISARFLLGGEKLYIYSNVEKSNNVLPLRGNLKFEKFEELLRDDNFKEVEKYLEGFWQLCRSEELQDSEKIRIELLELYHRLRKQALQFQINMDELKEDNGYNLYEVITQYDLISCIENGFSNILNQYKASRENCSKTKFREEIAAVKQYVRQNLNKDISVNSAAKIANMSESYFSHVFKDEMGLSFINYVNKIRVERAETLLRETNDKISEIALSVGIDNPNYFSILFKKITGKSPNECRS